MADPGLEALRIAVLEGQSHILALNCTVCPFRQSSGRCGLTDREVLCGDVPRPPWCPVRRSLKVELLPLPLPPGGEVETFWDHLRGEG